MPRLNPLRSVPWMVALQAVVHANEHWKQLSAAERAKLQRLATKSKGRPSNLSARERAEVKRLLGKLDLVGLGRDLLPFAPRRGRRR